MARDHDIVFAAVALLCGGILLFQSWRLDPILQFAQFLSIGSAIWFAYETIRLRGITTEQAKRSTPLVDDERPVSRVYRAELDELTPLDEQRNVTRRIRGSREGRPDDYDEQRGRGERYSSNDSRSSDSRSNDSRSSDSRRNSSRPLPPERDGNGSWDDAGEGSRGMRESIRDNSFSPRRGGSDRSAPNPRRRGGDADYVDYRPVDFPEGSEGSESSKDEWR